VVTANGDLIAVDEQHNADLFWAIRGGGPGFFGVITKYFLKVYPAPRAVTTTNYYFPLQLADEIGVWAGEAARRLPTAVELTVFHMAAPPPLAERCHPTTAIPASSVRARLWNPIARRRLRSRL
jgi:FAD/FMN-containing dehydrogenase